MTFTCTQQAVKYVRGAGPSAGEALDLETHRRPGSSRPPALVFKTGGMVATLGQQAELIGPPECPGFQESAVVHSFQGQSQLERFKYLP